MLVLIHAWPNLFEQISPTSVPISTLHAQLSQDVRSIVCMTLMHRFQHHVSRNGSFSLLTLGSSEIDCRQPATSLSDNPGIARMAASSRI